MVESLRKVPSRNNKATTQSPSRMDSTSTGGHYRDGSSQTDKSNDISPALTIAETLFIDNPSDHDNTAHKYEDYEVETELPPLAEDPVRVVDGMVFIDLSPNPRLSIVSPYENHRLSMISTFDSFTFPHTLDEPINLEMIERRKTGMDREDAMSVAQKEIKYIDGWKLASVMIALTTASFLILLDASIVVTAIPRITSDFHSLNDIGWYGSAYSLASGCLQPLTGKLYTYLNAKWTFLIFFVFFEIGSLICAIANTSSIFIAGRVIAGLGASGIQNGSITIMAGSAPIEKRPALLGMMMGFCQIGLVAGPLIGGAFTEYSTWRWCFYINLPVGALTALCMIFVDIPDYRSHQETPPGKLTLAKLDLPGFAIFVPFAIMMLLGLQWGGSEYEWNSPTIIGLLSGSAGIFVIFCIWEYRAGYGAMIPFPVLRKREIWSSCLTCLVLFASVICTAYYLAIYFQSARNASPFQGGINMLPGILGQLISAVFAGSLINAVGYYLPFGLFGGVLATVGNGMLSSLVPDSPTALWAAAQVVAGFGRGTAFQVPYLATQVHAPAAHLSVAVAMLTFCQTFGTAIFLSISNALFNNKLRSALQDLVPFPDPDTIIHAGAGSVNTIVPPENLPQALLAFSRAYQSVMYLVVALSGLTVVFTFGMGWTNIKPKKPAQTEEDGNAKGDFEEEEVNKKEMEAKSG